MLDRILVRLTARSAEEAVRTAGRFSGVGGFAVGAALISGPGPATIAAISRIGAVLVPWGLHGDRREVVDAAGRLAEYGARWIGVQAALDGEVLAALADTLHAAGAEPVAVPLDAGLDDPRVASLGMGGSRGRAVSRLAAACAAAGIGSVLCAVADLGVVAQVAPSMDRIADRVSSASAAAEAFERGAAYVVVAPDVAAELSR